MDWSAMDTYLLCLLLVCAWMIGDLRSRVNKLERKSCWTKKKEGA